MQVSNAFSSNRACDLKRPLPQIFQENIRTALAGPQGEAMDGSE